VIYRKTAKLFEAAAEAGGMLAGASRSAMASYGKHLGMAFQIADDVLDYQGDVSLTGKNVGDDLAEGKMTLPLIYARDKGSVTQRNIICDAITQKSAAQFAEIVAIVQDSGGIDYSMQKAQKEVDLAKQALLELEDSDFKVKMIELADFAVSRLI
jgi:octaprenyl-diphosphate synthase